MNDDNIKTLLEREGYILVRRLPTGEWAGLRDFAFTIGLCVGLDDTGYRARYCFESAAQAVVALTIWGGEGHPQGWIKVKGRDRTGTYLDNTPEEV
jgi:hypothetical protein